MNRCSTTLPWRRSAMPIVLSLLCLATAWPHAVLAVTHLKRGEAGPPIDLKDQNGAEVSNAKLRGHIAVLIFGELYHDRTRQACDQVATVLQDPRLAGLSIESVLIVTQEHPEVSQKASGTERLPASIARDPGRSAFGAYQVVVMPSLVVLDQEGRVVHALAGSIPRLGDLITDALLYAGGKLSAEGLDRSVQAQTVATPTDQGEVRASRLALLGRQLRRRGLDEMATAKLREALELEPKNAVAHQELGQLLLKQNRLAEAESEFRAVLAGQPDSIDATLALAFVQTLRADPAELGAAEKAARAVLARNPSLARAHYLLGLVQERRDKAADAAASYKKAAELLLDRAEQE